MLSEEALERLSERLVNRIEELNLFMIKKLGEQIVNIGELTPSQLRQVFQSVQYGSNFNDIVNMIAEITDKNVEDIYSIFEDVAKKNQSYAKQFYDYKKIPFIPFDENEELKSQVKAIAESTVNQYLNMSNTMAYVFINDTGVKEFTSLSGIYQRVTDRAVLSISQGRESFDTVVKKTMKDLTSQGLRTVDYASGYSRRMDSSVRMNIMDGVRRLNRELQTQFGKEFGADGIEVSHHKNAAPDHIDTVDGKQFSKEEYEQVNNSLERHVGELNCYHFIYPIILGVSKPLYSKEQLEADKKANKEGFEFEGTKYTNYQGTQLQRQLETKIRQYKDRQIGAKSIKDTKEVYHCQEKIDQLTQKYKELSDVSGLPTKVDRLRVEGFTRVKVSKNVINDDNFTNVTDKWLASATPNSHEVLDAKYFKVNDTKYKVDGKNVVLDYSTKEKEVANWLETTLGGKLYMCPRINVPDGISTPDYLFRNERYDLKEIRGSSSRVIDNAIKGKQNQATNFILDITESELNELELIKQAENIYNSKGRIWVERIIMKKNDKLVVIIERKKRD